MTKRLTRIAIHSYKTIESHPFLARKQGWSAIFAEEFFAIVHEGIVVIRFSQGVDRVYLHEVIAFAYNK